jgi:CheY-like chemotaxis protein
MNSPTTPQNHKALPPVIIVDDQEVETELAVRFYEKSRLKNPLITMRTGEALLDYLDSVNEEKSRMPAMVFLDIRMPELSGLDVLESIRKRPENMFEPPIHFLTHEFSSAIEERAYEMGADGFMNKPLERGGFIKFFNSLAKTLDKANDYLMKPLA